MSRLYYRKMLAFANFWNSTNCIRTKTKTLYWKNCTAKFVYFYRWFFFRWTTSILWTLLSIILKLLLVYNSSIIEQMSLDYTIIFCSTKIQWWELFFRSKEKKTKFFFNWWIPFARKFDFENKINKQHVEEIDRSIIDNNNQSFNLTNTMTNTQLEETTPIVEKK